MEILTKLPQTYPTLDPGMGSKEKTDTKTIMTHDDLLKRELIDFYQGTDYLKRMSSIINGKRLSLRLLDWFVCNYSKEYFTIYLIRRGTHDARFIVYVDYKTNLDIYSKKRFAPFCRHERVYVPYDEENYMETTVGQLNFFRWVFKNHILEYIESNYDDIKRDMDSRNTSRKRRNGSGSSTSSMEEGMVESKKVDLMDSVLELDSIGVGAVEPCVAEEVTTEWVSPSHPAVTTSKTKTRKKREELSHSACRSMRLEKANITIRFG